MAKEERCVYTIVSRDGYGDNWKTQCGNKVRCDCPIEVGISFAPLPNEDGKYCRFCGKLIEVKDK